MRRANCRVVLDACVLANHGVCDLFLRLAERPRLYSPIWSSGILEETARTQVTKLNWSQDLADHWRGCINHDDQKVKLVHAGWNGVRVRTCLTICPVRRWFAGIRRVGVIIVIGRRIQFRRHCRCLIWVPGSAHNGTASRWRSAVRSCDLVQVAWRW